MIITPQNTSHLEQTVTITLEPTDYRPVVEQSLKTMRSQVALKGFRKGMVPMGLVKKMYGTSVLAEEINKMFDAKLSQYLTDNKLEIFAQPLMQEPEEALQLEDGQNITLSFDLGLRPEMKLNLDKLSFPLYDIAPDEAQVEDTIKQLRNRFFENAFPTQVQDGDVLFLKLTELQADGTDMPQGITTVSTVKMADFADKATASLFIEKEKGFEIVANLDLIYADVAKKAKALKVDEEKASVYDKPFKVTLQNIMREGEATLDQSFFDKALGAGVVSSEAEFRNKITEELKVNLKGEAEAYFAKVIVQHLVDTINPEIPTAFLQRWLKTNSKNEVPSDQFEGYFDDFTKNLKIDLIENELLKYFNVEVNYEEILDFVEASIEGYYRQYNIDPGKDALRKEAINFLSKEDNYSRYYTQVKSQKTQKVLIEKIPFELKPIDFEGFKTMVQG